MEVVTVSVSRHGKHDEKVYQAMQEVWKEISKPFIEATDVKYIWARSNDNPESVHYFSINIFPSKEKREAWGKIYDHEKFQEEWNRLLKEKIGKTEDELEKPLEELELFGLEVDLTNF